tara:strand:+ start:2563 stop:3645 length:1083 start_codon:yes stop_codon:yes gene_type:complete
MKKSFIITLLLISNLAQGQFLKDIVKYSTLYTSYTESSPLWQPEQYFVTQAGEVQNITPSQTNDYMMSIGLRKIARFDYENKAKKFYDGSEQNSSLQSNSGSIKGLEYLFQYSQGKQQGREFTSQKYFIRYLAKYWSTKIEVQENGLINLDYKAADIRGRIPIGKKFNISIGAVVRTHKPYGYNPIDDYLIDSAWWDLAYDYGYQDHYYGIDYDNDGQLDNFDWWWSNPDGERVADTDLDFRKNDYQDIVNDYNETELDAIGILGTLSAVVGLDFYHYGNGGKWWLHSWGNVYPIHKHIYGDENFSYEDYLGKNDWMDFNYGVMFGWNITKKFGIFTEYEKTKFWDKNLMYLKAGLNWQL